MDTEGVNKDDAAMQMTISMQGGVEEKAAEGGQQFQAPAFVNQVREISVCIYTFESISHC